MPVKGGVVYPITMKDMEDRAYLDSVINQTMHALKTDSAVFEAVFSGMKTYELRKNTDRVFRVGDWLRLMETQHTGAEMAAHHDGAFPGGMVEGKPLVYTGRRAVVEVTHILNGPIYGLESGWSLLSFKRVEQESVGPTTIDYDFLLAEIDKEGGKAEAAIAAEKLAGNAVKEARAEGEFIAFNVMRSWLKRIRYLTA